MISLYQKIAVVRIDNEWNDIFVIGNRDIGFYVSNGKDVIEYSIQEIIDKALYYDEVNTVEDGFDFVEYYFFDVDKVKISIFE